MKHRRVGRRLSLRIFERPVHLTQPLAFTLEGGHAGAGMLRFVEGPRVQGGHVQRLSNQRARYAARGALPLAW